MRQTMQHTLGQIFTGLRTAIGADLSRYDDFYERDLRARARMTAKRTQAALQVVIENQTPTTLNRSGRTTQMLADSFRPTEYPNKDTIRRTAVFKSNEPVADSDAASPLLDLAIQAEESKADPITEVHVFMAYGRYETAEQRLKDAIRKEPNRADLKLELIELYYTTKNKPLFEATAQELHATLGEQADSDVNWKKVLDMGADLSPEHPLFKDVPIVKTIATAVAVGIAVEKTFKTEEEFNLDELAEPVEPDLIFDANRIASDEAFIDMNQESIDAADFEYDLSAPTAHEIRTALKIAKEYIDMGDPAGARSILDEVLEEGDASKQQQAEKLRKDSA